MRHDTALVRGIEMSADQAALALAEAISECDAVLVGAGAGLSTAAGLTYSGERFDANFADFRDAYGITDMYSGGFYPFLDSLTYWAWWSRHIYLNRYDVEPGKPYLDLLKMLDGKDYFVITTNVDHQFQLAGFDKTRSSTLRETTGCSSAREIARTRPTITRSRSARWWPSRKG